MSLTTDSVRSAASLSSGESCRAEGTSKSKLAKRRGSSFIFLEDGWAGVRCGSQVRGRDLKPVYELVRDLRQLEFAASFRRLVLSPQIRCHKTPDVLNHHCVLFSCF